MRIFSDEHKLKLSLSHKRPRPHMRTGSFITCKVCQKVFYVRRYRMKGNPEFCSSVCKGIKFRGKRMNQQTEIKRGQRISPKTEFKKGEKPFNYKGGISKTKEYRNFYSRKRKLRQKNIIGSHTLKEWENLKIKYNLTCPCCHRKEPEIKLTVDHIIPITKKGNNNIDNIQPLCRSCNSKKMTKIIRY